MSAREASIAEIIYAAHGYAPDGKTENARGEPYGEWAKAVKAARALTAAGWRLVGPDEVDPVTVETCAVKLEGCRSVFMRDGAAAIRAIASGGEQ